MTASRQAAPHHQTPSQPRAPTPLPRLFQASALGDIEIANRIIMAPLMRGCADEAAGDVPGCDMNMPYYLARCGAGLIIAETAHVSPEGKGQPGAPGIYSGAQLEGWRRITQAVHAGGTKIVAQIAHAGRLTHPALTGGLVPIGPSARAADAFVQTPQGSVPAPVPHALTGDEIHSVVQAFRHAAAQAMRAGFDGVEIHAADGGLLDQFLRDGSNHREDEYGGSIENRCRFALEVIDAVMAEAGAGRTGIRLSPVSPLNGQHDGDPQALFGHLIEELNKRGIAFAHFIEGCTGGSRDTAGFSYAWARKHFRGAYVANNGYTREMAIEAIEQDHADAVAFGRAFMANPDLVDRLRDDAPLRDIPGHDAPPPPGSLTPAMTRQ